MRLLCEHLERKKKKGLMRRDSHTHAYFFRGKITFERRKYRHVLLIIAVKE
jgi:hypothetical protein